MRTQEKLEQFVKLLEKEQVERLKKDKLCCQANIDNVKVSIKPGKKYTKVDLAGSGKYMVDTDGQIFGIKAYGQIHMGHKYGTLDTINQYSWGGYTACKKG